MSERLRIGLVIESHVQPRWVRRSIEKVVASDVAKLELVIRVEDEKVEKSSLLYKLYNRIDHGLFAAEAQEMVSIEDLLKGAVVRQGFDGLEAANLDVLINFASTELNASVADAAKHGVWFYSFGDPPGVTELMDQIPITVSSLQGFKDNKEYVVYQSVAPTLSRFSIRLNTNTCYWKSAAFVARALEDLHQQRTVQTNINDNVAKLPTNAAMAQMFFSLSGRAASRAYEKLSTFEQWVLAYRIGKGEYKYLIPPADRFWADPFPLKVDDRYYIFFEDYVNSRGKAHISVIEVDQNGIVSGPAEALKLECHLSYPFLFDWRGDHYMIPETGDRNVVELYRCVSFPEKWEPVSVLLEANCPLDTTLVEVDGMWWMFVSVQEEGVAVNWDELHLYHAEGPLGPWRPHARNPIVSDVRSARPAGNLFWSDGALFRPSQDSSLRYGYATTINKVIKLSPTEYSETEVLKILPDWERDIIGVHTLNLLEDLTVIDCLARRRRYRGLRLRPPSGSLDLLSSANMATRGEASLGGASRMKI
jgi:hypothetical protein